MKKQLKESALYTIGFAAPFLLAGFPPAFNHFMRALAHLGQIPMIGE